MIAAIPAWLFVGSIFRGDSDAFFTDGFFAFEAGALRAAVFLAGFAAFRAAGALRGADAFADFLAGVFFLAVAINQDAPGG